MDLVFSDDEFEGDEDSREFFADLDKPIENFDEEWDEEEKTAEGMLPSKGVPEEL